MVIFDDDVWHKAQPLETRQDIQLFLNTNDRDKTLFASLIAFAINKNHNSLEKKLTKKCLQLKKKIKKGGDNWVSQNTYNTLSTYSLVDQKIFYLFKIL